MADTIIQLNAGNRAERRREARDGEKRGVEPIKWLQTSSNSYATSFGPWRIEVTELPSLSAVDPPNYSFKVTPVNEKLPEVHSYKEAQVVAVRFLALALKAGMEDLIKHGVIGVRQKQ